MSVIIPKLSGRGGMGEREESSGTFANPDGVARHGAQGKMKLINFDLASRIFVKGISRISFLPPSETDDFRSLPLFSYAIC